MRQESNAFTEAVINLLPELRSFARSLSSSNGAQSDDLVQETFLRAWAARGAFADGNLRAWLFTIMRNVFYSSHRSLRREVADIDNAIANKIAVDPEQLLNVELAELNDAMMKLSEDQRNALLLVCGEGMSCEEAAAMCNCRIGTIKSRISRGRDRLSELLHSQRDYEFGVA